MARPQKRSFDCPPVLLIVVFVTVLAGYTLFLHERLAFDSSRQAHTADRQTSILHSERADSAVDGDGGDISATSLVRRTAVLAAEVASLSRQLEEKQKRLQKNQVVRPLLADKGAKQQTQQPQQEDGQRQRQEQQQQQRQQRQQQRDGKGQEQPADTAALAEDWQQRQQAVVGAMRHAWGGYVKYAWGHDELDPVGKTGKDEFGGVGATIVDSLDTLWLMGLKEEFQAARDWTANNLTFNVDHDSSVFETTIRVVGGLLAAHDLSGDAMFARRAQEIGDLLMFAFGTPTGIPHGTINLRSLQSYNPSWSGGASGLAEFGSEQLEFIKLSDWTGNATYARLVEGNVALMHDKYPDQGLLPYYISPNDGRLLNNHITFGAMGDSYYEYLLKVWLLKGKKDDMYRAMWEKAMDETAAQLIFNKGNLTYIAELQSGAPYHKMDHLACFAPGMLALGAKYGAVAGAKAEQYMQLARNLTETCYQMYARQPTGLAPELVVFDGETMAAGAVHNLLRPETAEALFVLWRTTGDVLYRRQGWAIFQAFEKHCKVLLSAAALSD